MFLSLVPYTVRPEPFGYVYAAQLIPLIYEGIYPPLAGCKKGHLYGNLGLALFSIPVIMDFL